MIVSALVSSAVGHEFEPRSGQIKDPMKLVFVASLLRKKKEERTKSGFLGMKIIYLSGVYQRGSHTNSTKRVV